MTPSEDIRDMMTPPVTPPEKAALQLMLENWKDAEQFASLSRQFEDVAWTDYKAAKVLFNEKLYAPAVFHIQQAVEKGLKAYGLRFGFLTEHDLKGAGVGHKTPMVFIKFLMSSKIKDIIRALDPPSIEDADEDLKKWKILIERPNDLARIPKTEMHHVLTKHRPLREELNWSLSQLNRKEQPRRISLSDFKRLRKGLLAGMQLSFYLALLTFVHWEGSRYPTPVISPKDYTLELGIVSAFEDILGDTEAILRTIALQISLTECDFNNLLGAQGAPLP